MRGRDWETIGRMECGVVHPLNLQRFYANLSNNLNLQKNLNQIKSSSFSIVIKQATKLPRLNSELLTCGVLKLIFSFEINNNISSYSHRKVVEHVAICEAIATVTLVADFAGRI